MRTATDQRRLRDDLEKAVARELPVTITYTDERGNTSVRTVEPYGKFIRTLSGEFIVKAMDRETGRPRSWRLDRIELYTVHRGSFQVEPSVPQDAARWTPPKPEVLDWDAEWADFNELIRDPDCPVPYLPTEE